MDIGLLAAFVGGALALLSPCGALLLPAFFASTIGSTPRLVVHGVAFYLGLVITLVPLGLGLGALGELAVTHRDLMIGGVSVLLIGLGLAQALGLGFDLGRLAPGTDRTMNRRGLIRTVLLGATGGVAGFCTGPILGAVLTLAMSSGDTLSAGLLLAVYGLGMVLPLLALAAGWDHLGTRTLRILRGRGFTVGGRHLHTTTVISGILTILLGIAFHATNGLVDAPQLLSADTQAFLQEKVGGLAGPMIDIVAVLTIATLALTTWWFWPRRADRQDQQS